MTRYYSKTPDDPDTWGAVGSLGALGRPAPAHTMAKAARQARKAVRGYAAERNAQRAELVEAGSVAAAKPPHAERIDLAELTGSPRLFARRLGTVDARLAATRSRDGQRLSVWAVTLGGRRVRALYKRTATGWGSDGVLIDGRAVGVTAALAELEGDRAVPRGAR